MRTGGKRKILVKSGRSKSQPLDTNPRHECSQRGPIGARNTAPPRPDGLRSPPSGGACYRELRRIPLPRNPMNKVNEHKVAGLASPTDVVGNIKSGKRASQKRGDLRSHERCHTNLELVEGEGPYCRGRPHRG